MSGWEFKIEPHPARRIVFGKPVVHIRDVQMLMVRDEDGRFVQVGYCGAEPGRPLTLLEDWGPEFLEAAAEFVTREVGPPKATVVAKTKPKDEVEDES